MADADRRPSAAVKQRRKKQLPVKEDLLQNTTSYAFFQAIRLLRYFAGREGMHDDERFLNENLRIRPHLSLAFPGTDMTDMQEVRDEDEGILQYHITATFLEMYGSSSPLPTFYTEDLLGDANEDITVVQDFLNIINTPLYPLFIRSWSKYRLMIKVLDEREQAYLERLYCLCGLGLPELRKEIQHPYRLLRYIGLFTQWPRSALGLKTLLSDALGGVPVDVEPCKHRRVRIPDDQRLQLGVQGNMLGEEAVLGELVDDRLGKIAIHIGPMNAHDYHDNLPGTDRYDWIVQLIRLYLVEPLTCELRYSMIPEEARQVKLGGFTWAAVGYDTWLYSSAIPPEAAATFQVTEFTL